VDVVVVGSLNRNGVALSGNSVVCFK